MPETPSPHDLDKAVRSRLARLASLPVDTSKLERSLRAAAEAEVPTSPRRRNPFRWFPLTTAAAAILIVAIVGIVVMSWGTSPAIASPADLARIHAEVLKPDGTATAVSTLDQANRVLARQWSDKPDLPAPPAEQLHACCIHRFMDRKVACLLLRDGDTPLTMVVGYARDFKCADGRMVERDGKMFMLHQVNGLHMVMTEQAGRYVCLMGDEPEDRLLEIAQGLKF